MENGRHVGTRTPDLYRVNESLTSIYNNIGSTDGDRKHWKYTVDGEVVYHDVYHDFAPWEKCKMNLDFGVKKLISAVMRPNAKSVPTLNERRSNGISTGAVQRQLQSLTNWQTAPAFTVMLMLTNFTAIPMA